MARKVSTPKVSVQFLIPHTTRLRLEKVLEQQQRTITDFMNALVENELDALGIPDVPIEP